MYLCMYVRVVFVSSPWISLCSWPVFQCTYTLSDYISKRVPKVCSRQNQWFIHSKVKCNCTAFVKNRSAVRLSVTDSWFTIKRIHLFPPLCIKAECFGGAKPGAQRTGPPMCSGECSAPQKHQRHWTAHHTACEDCLCECSTRTHAHTHAHTHTNMARKTCPTLVSLLK